MPAPNKRSRSYRRVFKKTPGGKNKIHYEKRKPSKAICGGCGAVLPGTANKRAFKMQNMAKTAKRPSRPYGGVLCSKCMRELQIERARQND